MNDFWNWFREIEPQLGNRRKSYAKIFEYLDGFKRPSNDYRNRLRPQGQ